MLTISKLCQAGQLEEDTFVVTCSRHILYMVRNGKWSRCIHMAIILRIEDRWMLHNPIQIQPNTNYLPTGLQVRWTDRFTTHSTQA